MARKKMTEEEKKPKINLKINENLLEEFDKLIGDEKRSRVIEELLKKYIDENKDKI